MGRGGFGSSSDRVRAVKAKPRVANRALDATRLRTASILGSERYYTALKMADLTRAKSVVGACRPLNYITTLCRRVRFKKGVQGTIEFYMYMDV